MLGWKSKILQSTKVHLWLLFLARPHETVPGIGVGIIYNSLTNFL